MDTASIKTIFADYLNTEKTQHAILINGAWGTGKTHLWKKSLSRVAEEHDFKTVYISLNGISKIEALDYSLFIKLVPYIGKQENTIAKNVTTLFTNILNQTSRHFLNASLTDIFKNVSVDSFNFTKYVICFDDLERCGIPITEALGFINTYVEHKNLKTIILADETKLNSDPKGYNNIKEKVIGRILNYEPDINELTLSLFEKYKASGIDFYNFLLKHRLEIVNIFMQYKEDNIRIVSFYLDILERIFPFFQGEDEEYIQEIIFFAAIISIEFKKGNLKSSDYKNPQGIDSVNEYTYSLYSARKGKRPENDKEENDKEYAEEFYETYLKEKAKNYYFYPSIFAFILSGYLELSEFKEEIKTRYPENLSIEIRDFKALLNYYFRELSDKNFRSLTINVLQFAREGRYNIYDYAKIASFFYYFADHYLINESKDEVTKAVLEGLKKAENRKEINDNILEGLLHFHEESSDVAEIKGIIKGIHQSIKKEQYVAESNKFIDCLCNSEDELKEMFKKNLFSKELFQFMDIKRLSEAILNISNKQLSNFSQLMCERYKIANVEEFFVSDYECLKALNYNLRDFLENNSDLPPLKKYLLISLCETLGAVCSRLKVV
jgi:hypothetical protein